MRDKKAPAKSSKTDALRAQREEQHREMMAQRAANERAARAENTKRVQAKEPEDLARDEASVQQEQADVEAAMPPTFKAWKAKVEELRAGEVDWADVEVNEAAEEAFDNGVLPGEFAAGLEDTEEVE